MNFTIKYVGLHRGGERLEGVCPNLSVNLAMAGVEYRRIYGREFSKPGPMFVVGIKDAPFRTVFNSKRENWHIALEDLSLTQDSKTPDRGVLRLGGETVGIPLLIPVPTIELPEWKQEMKRIKRSFEQPTAEHVLRMKIAILGIFRRLLDADNIPHQLSPESKLKKLIDSDRSFSKTLSCLSEECGMSTDHLRVLFKRRFNISPKSYQNQKRVAFVMELIANSDLQVKEIAWRVGFSSETSFSSMFKRLSGLSPQEAINKYRKAI